MPWRDRVEISTPGGWASVLENELEDEMKKLEAQVAKKEQDTFGDVCEAPLQSEGKDAVATVLMDPTELLELLQSEGVKTHQEPTPLCMESTMTLLRDILQVLPSGDDVDS